MWNKLKYFIFGRPLDYNGYEQMMFKVNWKEADRRMRQRIDDIVYKEMIENPLETFLHEEALKLGYEK